MPDVLIPVGNQSSLEHARLKYLEQPDGSHAMAVAVLSSSGGSPVDREIVISTYRARNNGTGYSTGDVITATRVLDVSGSSATQVGSTVWYNESTSATLGAAPTAGHLEIVGQPGLTDAQLRAAPVASTGFAAIGTGTFTRPADTTTYASGDLIANSTTAGSVVPLQVAAARVAAGSFGINRIRMRKTGNGVANALFRVHLFSAAPTVANGDNGVLLTSGSANYIGSVDVDMTRVNVFNDGAAAQADCGFVVALASGQNIWALIEARGAYAPGNAEQFAVLAEVVQN